MSYKFNIAQLEISSALISDASVDVDSISKEAIKSIIKYEIVRRTFENDQKACFYSGIKLFITATNQS